MKSLVMNNNNMANNIHHSKRNAENPVQNVRPSKSSRSNSEYRTIIFQNEVDIGFKVTRNLPFTIRSLVRDCLAFKSGLREYDTIVKVNDISVSDKDIIYVTNLLKKYNTIKLLIEPNNNRNGSTINISNTKLRNPPNPVSRSQKNDHNTVRPTSAPKPIPKPILRPKSMAVPGNLSQNAHQPIRHTNNSPKKDVHENKNSLEKSLSIESSSDSSMDTSSYESNALKMINPKTLSVTSTSSRPLPSSVPTQSNSYNTPNVKKRPPPPPIMIGNQLQNISQPKAKNKTIPTDGAKSFNITKGNDNEIKPNERSNSQTLPKQISNGRILGRDFDNDSETEEGSNISILIKMLKSAKNVLSKPGLIAILLEFTKEKFDDMNIMIFYYSCKFYKSLSLKREFLNDAQRMANEIITTFLFEKSPLFIKSDIDIITDILKNLKSNEKLKTIFDTILEKVYGRLEGIIADFRGKLERGIQWSEDVSSSVNAFNPILNQERDLKQLNRSICNIFIKSPKESNFNDSVLATQVALATMFEFFYRLYIVHGAGARARSSDSINRPNVQNKMISISEYFKITTLCANYQIKSSQSFRKKSKTVNGHVLIEAVCQEPAECSICEELLWGVSPQGLFCTMCTNYYHVKCKKKIKTSCARKLRKSNSQLNKEEKPLFLGRLSRKSSTNSARSPLSADFHNNNGNQFFGNGHLNPDDKISPALLDGVINISKSQSAEQINRGAQINSQFERVGSGYDLKGSLVNQSGEIGSLQNDQGAVHFQELVDESLNDPDMKVDESFDADFELNAVFPKLNQEVDKRILIVLLEFHHKAKYLLMNLKRLWYSIVQKWPQSQSFYSKAFSLDCICPLMTLIKSLVMTIENCVTEQDFDGLAQAVLNWLSENNDDKLKRWLSLSSNLCCTNSLTIVKNLKEIPLRTVPELTNLLKVKFNKRVMIDELAQIRPLLISLPFIAKNIIKSLSKEESKYSEEIALWKQISTKMDYLCEYIDRCCIPFVDSVNNGLILRKLEKFDGQIKWKDDENDIRDFYNDFPRTMFHFQIFDFQITKIIDWSTNTENRGIDIQTTYLKKGTEVLLIIYQRVIIFLQKENDHYFLKPIKSFKTLAEKKPPFIIISNDLLFKNGGQADNQFVLNVISNKPGNALLLRIGFSRLEVLDSWLDFINTKNYNLAKSISLFKTNDIGILAESVPHFERVSSSISIRPKPVNDSTDSPVIPPTNLEIEDKDLETSIPFYLSLSKGLTNAHEAMDLKTSLCAILKVSETDLPSKLQIIKDEGVKLIEELAVMMYLLSQATIQQTHQILAKCCSKVAFSSDFDVDQVKDILTTNLDILAKWDKSNKIIDEIESEIVVQLRSSPRRSHYDPWQEDLESSEIVPNDNSVDDIIEDPTKEARYNKGYRESYKYEPSESQLPPIDADNFKNNEVLPSNYVIDTSLANESITVSRAQIIVRNRNSLFGSDC